jgi:hypothetical protein
VDAADLGWDPLRSADGKPGVSIKVSHPRAGEVVIKGVEPRWFKVTLVESEAPEEQLEVAE